MYLAARRGVAHIPAMDRSAEVELAALRRMSAEEKLAVMHGLWRTSWDLTAIGVRRRHPDWSEDRVLTEVRAHFARDGD
jgi:hypothetical protein